MSIIIPIKVLKDNYVWCLISHNNTCLVVDPGEAQPVISFLQEKRLNLKAILVTHHHFDHTGGIKDLLLFKKVPVYGPSQISVVSEAVDGHTIVEIPEMNHQFRIMTVPGHTLDHIAYFRPGVCFTGDTLFTGGCGKIFEGTAQQMYDSLNKLMQLPDETLIYCGHEYTASNLTFAELVEPNNDQIKKRLKKTNELRACGLETVPETLSVEKATNPFLRVNHPDVIAATSSYYKEPISDPVHVLSALREWKNRCNCSAQC